MSKDFFVPSFASDDAHQESAMAGAASRDVAPPDIVERLRVALEKTAAALMTVNDDDKRLIKFMGAWAHLGTMTVGQILDEADTALDGGKING